MPGKKTTFIKMSDWYDKSINVKCLQSLLQYEMRRLLPALHWHNNHNAILSPQDTPAFIRRPQNDVNPDPSMPRSGIHVSTPLLVFD